MRKAFMAATLALAMSLTAASGYAATTKSSETTPNLSPAVQPLQVSETLAKEIFLAAPGAKVKPVAGLIDWGVCSWTCEPCNNFWGCPKDEFGHFQSCLSECP